MGEVDRRPRAEGGHTCWGLARGRPPTTCQVAPSPPKVLNPGNGFTTNKAVFVVKTQLGWQGHKSPAALEAHQPASCLPWRREGHRWCPTLETQRALGQHGARSKATPVSLQSAVGPKIPGGVMWFWLPSSKALERSGCPIAQGGVILPSRNATPTETHTPRH